ncbi:hypothetical protein, partial [Adlercreutzia muris]|uniref:hypothetical protein n=1 Tax=Adlercreutzia muris TaxID=1796610 RepID=UPI0035169CF4
QARTDGQWICALTHCGITTRGCRNTQQHAADLLDARKQELLIEELTAIANRFKKLDDELVRITEAYAYRMGVTEEQISHELELLKSQDG